VARASSPCSSARRAPWGARARLLADLGEDRVDLADGEGGGGSRGGGVAQGGPAQADLALAQLARQERDGDGHLRRVGAPQRRGDHVDLGEA